MRFDLSKYSTVADRLKKFHEDHPDGRIYTQIDNIDGEIGKTRWVVKATIYLSAGDQAEGLPKATGFAFEVDGTGGANATSALENCESSAIGRALMVAGYSMSKEGNLASREEMSKVERGRDWLAEADRLADVNALRWLHVQAKAADAPTEVLKEIERRARAIDTGSEDPGASGGVSGSERKTK